MMFSALRDLAHVSLTASHTKPPRDRSGSVDSKSRPNRWPSFRIRKPERNSSQEDGDNEKDKASLVDPKSDAAVASSSFEFIEKMVRPTRTRCLIAADALLSIDKDVKAETLLDDVNGREEVSLVAVLKELDRNTSGDDSTTASPTSDSGEDSVSTHPDPPSTIALKSSQTQDTVGSPCGSLGDPLSDTTKVNDVVSAPPGLSGEPPVSADDFQHPIPNSESDRSAIEYPNSPVGSDILVALDAFDPEAVSCSGSCYILPARSLQTIYEEDSTTFHGDNSVGSVLFALGHPDVHSAGLSVNEVDSDDAIRANDRSLRSVVMPLPQSSMSGALRFHQLAMNILGSGEGWPYLSQQLPLFRLYNPGLLGFSTHFEVVYDAVVTHDYNPLD